MRLLSLFLVSIPHISEALSIAAVSRRHVLLTGFSFPSFAIPLIAGAAPDCMTDCLKSCKEIAPKDPGYCLDNCEYYCDQSDRTDGLSGSISSENGETGILGLTTVVKGEDRPPQVKLPGLDFTSKTGKELLGY